MDAARRGAKIRNSIATAKREMTDEEIVQAADLGKSFVEEGDHERIDDLLGTGKSRGR